MSHLSRIKTSIIHKEILIKTLQDLNFTYKNTSGNSTNNHGTNYDNITVQKNSKDLFIFLWNGKEYSLLADLQIWTMDIPYTKVLEKITQQYSYNTILQESAKYGFTNINQQTLEDGSIQLVVQKWK
uniref:hypothetical protein n=1 Tax=Hypnea pseudomusciformis TaxID=1545697 RepID=UPI0027DA5FC1|nr:hypothetical protein P4C74_pgp193 [Hypnea pseudomusciformis]WCH55040.1 hypothetical protein [Hypnea pseudomusciformis]WCH55439.1 hypothetical protein [Hypnea pseudomusciformis]WCH56633.1 hypothetical protein [Hypnea pseudomusciformis]